MNELNQDMNEDSDLRRSLLHYGVIPPTVGETRDNATSVMTTKEKNSPTASKPSLSLFKTLNVIEENSRKDIKVEYI